MNIAQDLTSMAFGAIGAGAFGSALSLMKVNDQKSKGTYNRNDAIKTTVGAVFSGSVVGAAAVGLAIGLKKLISYGWDVIPAGTGAAVIGSSTSFLKSSRSFIAEKAANTSASYLALPLAAQIAIPVSIVAAIVLGVSAAYLYKNRNNPATAARSSGASLDSTATDTAADTSIDPATTTEDAVEKKDDSPIDTN